MDQYVSVTPAEAGISRDGVIKLHGAEGFEGMRRAGRLAAEILDALVPHVVPGVSTEELDDIVREMTMRGGGVPAPWAIAAIRIAAAFRSITSSATAFRRKKS
jgi:methionyl aminopeptidase